MLNASMPLVLIISQQVLQFLVCFLHDGAASATGKGVVADVGGHAVAVGNDRLMADVCGKDASATETPRQPWSDRGKQCCTHCQFCPAAKST